MVRDTTETSRAWIAKLGGNGLCLLSSGRDQHGETFRFRPNSMETIKILVRACEREGWKVRTIDTETPIVDVVF